MRFIIVGAGLAGITIANRLCEYGFECVLIERGGNQSVPDLTHLYTSKHFGLNVTNGIGVGGSTEFWHSGLVVMPDKIVDKYASPLLSRLLSSLKSKYYKIAISHVTGKEASELCKELQQSDESYVKIYYPFSPYKPKINKNIKIYTDAEILNIKCSNRLFVSMQINVDGKTITESGDSIIISGGGLGSPEIIYKHFLGSQNLNLSKKLVDHPMNFVGKIKLNRIKNFKLHPLKKLDDGVLRTGYVLNPKCDRYRHVLYFRPCFDLKLRPNIIQKKLAAAAFFNNKKYLRLIPLLFDLDIISEAIYTKFNIDFRTNYYSVFAMIDQSESIDNQIQYCDNKKIISWSISEIDWQDFKSSLNEFFTSRGVEFVEDPNSYQGFTSAAHFSNTISVGDSEINGVVNDDLRLFGFSNVYVCDGSVVPRIGAVNTGLTIVALALRLCDYFRELRSIKLKKQEAKGEI